MGPVAEDIRELPDQLQSVASAMAGMRCGHTHATLVRMSDTVVSLLEAAKPHDQSMPEFLREAAIYVALQRMEAGQIEEKR